MVDVRGDVLRPPHGTSPAAVKSNKNQKSALNSSIKSTGIEAKDTVQYLGALLGQSLSNEKMIA